MTDITFVVSKNEKFVFHFLFEYNDVNHHHYVTVLSYTSP